MPKGSCLCGTIQYEVVGPLTDIDHCHCSRCRRSHGSAFATYGRTAKANFRILSGESTLKHFESSEAATRSFCSQCGSSILFQHSALPDFNFVAVGTLDEDPGSLPEAHIFVGSKASWFTIEDDLPQHESYPPGVGD